MFYRGRSAAAVVIDGPRAMALATALLDSREAQPPRMNADDGSLWPTTWSKLLCGGQATDTTEHDFLMLPASRSCRPTWQAIVCLGEAADPSLPSSLLRFGALVLEVLGSLVRTEI